MLGGDDLVARFQKRVTDKLDQFVGAVAEDHVGARNAELLRNRLAQIVAAAIGVDVGFLQRRVHGFERFGRRPERVFVRGEFADLRRLQPELARDIFNRLSGFVAYKIAELGVGGVPDRHKAGHFRGSTIKRKNDDAVPEA